MKKLLFVMICCVGCATAPKTTITITGIEPLTTQGNCIYSVKSDTSEVPYTFIDECGKYKIGETIK